MLKTNKTDDDDMLESNPLGGLYSLEKHLRIMGELISLRRMTGSPALIIVGWSPPMVIPAGVYPDNVHDYLENLVRPVFFLSEASSRISCIRCVYEIYDYWRPRKQRSINERISIRETLRSARESFSTQHNRWRSRMIKNTGYCSCCGTAEDLELAHITPVEEFFYKYGRRRILRHPTLKHRGIELSYRDDNLLLLCRTCHDAQTLGWGIWHAHENPETFLELMHRRHRVLDMFEEIIGKRGWRSAEDLQQTRLF